MKERCGNCAYNFEATWDNRKYCFLHRGFTQKNDKCPYFKERKDKEK